jgi:hypothetical protein
LLPNFCGPTSPSPHLFAPYFHIAALLQYEKCRGVKEEVRGELGVCKIRERRRPLNTFYSFCICLPPLSQLLRSNRRERGEEDEKTCNKIAGASPLSPKSPKRTHPPLSSLSLPPISHIVALLQYGNRGEREEGRGGGAFCERGEKNEGCAPALIGGLQGKHPISTGGRGRRERGRRKGGEG